MPQHGDRHVAHLPFQELIKRILAISSAGFGRVGVSFFSRHFGALVGVPSPDEGEKLLVDPVVPDYPERGSFDPLRRRIFLRLAGRIAAQLCAFAAVGSFSYYILLRKWSDFRFDLRT